MSDLWWGFQATIAGICAVIFATLTIEDVYSRWHYAHPFQKDERSPIVGMGLTMIAIGNVFTAYATGAGDAAMRNTAGVVIRGVLVILAVYLAAWTVSQIYHLMPPRPPRDRP